MNINSPVLSKDAFNRIAGQLNYPFLMNAKVDDPSHLTPGDLEFICKDYEHLYVNNNTFTDLFKQAYGQMVESERRAQVARTLARSRTVEQITDLSRLPPSEQLMVKHLIVVAQKVEHLFMKQQGSSQFIDRMQATRDSDPLSYKLFWRNQGPWCLDSNNHPLCHALPTFEKRTYPVFPADVELDDAFFATLAKDKELASPWTVVTKNEKGELVAVPYHIHYKTEMEEIAQELEASAAAIKNDWNEKALYDYLVAAASAFRTGDWDSADEMWVAMNRNNSKFALRVAPDETYWAPGNLKAGFEFWLALINTGMVDFSNSIRPYLQGMEYQMGVLVPDYKPRVRTFDIPDSIEVILRSGDHRSDVGAIVGQKLPNFNEKHARMVVMTNYDYRSVEQKKNKRELISAIFVPEIAAQFGDNDDAYAAMGTLLHEVTHSLGVQGSSFNIRNLDGSEKCDADGKPVTSKAALGGENDQIFEELKAQTGALYWIAWLKDKGVITDEAARKIYLDSIRWTFGHIAQGMKESNGSPKTYSQLAAIQIRHFLKTGAMSVVEGKFNIHWDKLHASVTHLFQQVIAIQVYGNKDAADAMRLDICEGEGFAAIGASELKALYEQYPQTTYDLKIAPL